MDHLTIVMAYYEQPQMLREWCRHLMTYGDLLARVSVRVTDDGSAKHPAHIPRELRDRCDVRLFRVIDEIPWNEMGARNLGMKHSEGWCFMTDPDYVLAEPEVRKLFGEIEIGRGGERGAEKLTRGNLYHLRSRVFQTKKELHRPENMAVVHADDFWAAGGYNEDFAGGYGFSDTLLFRTLKEGVKARDTFAMNAWMDHYPKGQWKSLFTSEFIEDAATPMPRDTRRNQPIWKRANAEIAHKGWKRYIQAQRPIRFRWEEVT